MIPAPEDQRAADAHAEDREDQQELFDDLDRVGEADEATLSIQKETVGGDADDELAADEKIRQREELLEETASI